MGNAFAVLGSQFMSVWAEVDSSNFKSVGLQDAILDLACNRSTKNKELLNAASLFIACLLRSKAISEK